jgi:hypothetical protein
LSVNKICKLCSHEQNVKWRKKKEDKEKKKMKGKEKEKTKQENKTGNKLDPSLRELRRIRRRRRGGGGRRRRLGKNERKTKDGKYVDLWTH